MDDFCAARSWTIPPLPWPSFAPPCALGTLLGVILVALMNTTLIMWGIPSSWNNVVIGLLLFLGTGIPAVRSKWRLA